MNRMAIDGIARAGKISAMSLDGNKVDRSPPASSFLDIDFASEDHAVHHDTLRYLWRYRIMLYEETKNVPGRPERFFQKISFCEKSKIYESFKDDNSSEFNLRGNVSASADAQNLITIHISNLKKKKTFFLGIFSLVFNTYVFSSKSVFITYELFCQWLPRRKRDWIHRNGGSECLASENLFLRIFLLFIATCEITPSTTTPWGFLECINWWDTQKRKMR